MGDYALQQRVATVDAIDPSTAQQIESYILDYGETLASLPTSTWDTSVSRWMEGYWELLVELYTVESGESDLVLSARVFEHGDGQYRIEVMGVYVP